MAITALLCYSHEDKLMVNHFKKHLKPLERNGAIALWDYGRINPGADWEQEINKHLNEAQMILLLISPSFIDSNYCYTVEMQRAIERHECKEVCVIPVLLRHASWEDPPLDKLQVLPDGAKPISAWRLRDEGFKNVVDGIARVVDQWNSHSLADPIAQERKTLITNLDQLIEAVKLQMQPPPRAVATANTLQQVSIFIPNEVTLADIVVGWQTLSQASQQGEDPATAQRRVTCGELAHLASQFTTDQGDLAQAIKTWRIWRDAFKNRDDPRQTAMARTFARELTELEALAIS